MIRASHVVVLLSFVTHSELDAGFTFKSVVLVSDSTQILSGLVNLFV